MKVWKTLIKKIRNHIQRIWIRIRPDEYAWQGATYGIFAVTAAIFLAWGISMAYGSWAFITVATLTVLGVALVFLSGALVNLIVDILNALPGNFRAALIGSAAVLALLVLSDLSLPGIAVLLTAAILPAALLGAGAWGLVRSRGQDQAPVRCRIAILSTTLGVAGLVAGIAWYLWPGPQTSPTVNAAWQNAADIDPLSAQDPAQPGPYSIKTLTYGSGNDKHRPEYGAQAQLHTPTVDGSPFVDNWQGFQANLRTRYWGFDVKTLPLNGRVWYPDGPGPYPLALIVHGNHFMMDYSDPGYAYLGELLASRGIILVSVDQNFLNGSWTDFGISGPAGLETENDGRGWLLLEHLTQWQQWNEAEGNPFFGKVDMELIALMGHSRGGEAAAIAAAFNRLPAYPDDATIKFDYNFNIRSVVAIAPSDGQYRPTGRSTPLENINYLAIQGAYDGDVQPFQGLRQYNRIQFTDDTPWFKSAVYVDRANHGQFNTSWGRSDSAGFPATGLLNLAPIMPAADQRQVAKVYISAFLETTLLDNREYLPLFRDPRAGRVWLPETVYLTRYADNRMDIIADYEEDIDVTTAGLDGAFFSSEYLMRWHESLVYLKWDNQQTNAVFLGWDNPAMRETAFYALDVGELDRAELGITPQSELLFNLADGNMNPNPHQRGIPHQQPAGEGEAGSPFIDLTIELVDRAGQRAHLPLSHFSLLQPQIEFHPLKARILETGDTAPGEAIFQSYALPMTEFQAVNSRFDLGNLAEIRFIFDHTPRGVVVLDEIGFRN